MGVFVGGVIVETYVDMALKKRRGKPPLSRHKLVIGEKRKKGRPDARTWRGRGEGEKVWGVR